MDSEILNSVISGSIGAVATILSTVVDLPSSEKRKVRKALIGRWNVKWYEYEGLNTDKETLIVEDYHEIKRVFKDKFKTKVAKTPKIYSVTGKIDFNNITYEFQGIDCFGINGTGVLSISLNRKKMTGHWLQIDNNEKNIFERCIWEKID